VVIVGLLWFMALAYRKREWGMLLAQLGAAAVVVGVGFFPDLFPPRAGWRRPVTSPDVAASDWPAHPPLTSFANQRGVLLCFHWTR
jgi:hypothetical protein